jgi:hypothetical protein
MAPFVDGDDLTNNFKRVAELIAKEHGVVKRNVLVANPRTKTDYEVFCSPDISWSQDDLGKVIDKINDLFSRPSLKLVDVHL